MATKNKFRIPSELIIKDKSLASKVVQVVRTMIIKGECPSGTRLIEADIAKSLGVSRACVREAFFMLEDEGLIHRVLNKYTEVVEFNKDDIEEIYKIRLAIEKICIHTCIEKNAVPIDELRECERRIKDIENETDMDCIEWIEEDLKFHELIIASSDNKRANKIWKGLKSQIRMLLFPIVTQNIKILSLGVGSHNSIIEAFIESDINGILSLLEGHIMSGCELAIKVNSDNL